MCDTAVSWEADGWKMAIKGDSVDVGGLFVWCSVRYSVLAMIRYIIDLQVMPCVQRSIKTIIFTARYVGAFAPYLTISFYSD